MSPELQKRIGRDPTFGGRVRVRGAGYRSEEVHERPRNVDPGTGMLRPDNDRENLIATLKFLATIIVVGLIVLGVTYWLTR